MILDLHGKPGYDVRKLPEGGRTEENIRDERKDTG